MANDKIVDRKFQKEEIRKLQAEAKALEKRKKEEAKALKKKRKADKKKKLSKIDTKKKRFVIPKIELFGYHLIQTLDIFNEGLEIVIAALGRGIENGAAYFIVYLDFILDFFTWAFTRILIFTLRKLHNFRVSINTVRKSLIRWALSIGVVGMILTVTYGSVIDYEYLYNGRVLGIVDDQAEVVDILDLVSEELSQEYEVAIKIKPERDIQFKPVLSMNKDIDKADDVLKKFAYLGDINVTACGIYANDKFAVALDTEEAANDVIEMLKEKFLRGEGTYEEVNFIEDVELKEVQISLARLLNKEAAMDYILNATSVSMHTIADGDTIEGICKNYNITESVLRDANPEIDFDKGLQIGVSIKIVTNKPLLTLETVRVAQFAQAIPFETEYEDSSSYYMDTYIVSREGSEGRTSVVARVKEVNGQFVSQDILSEEVLVEPISRIVTHGTKPIPPREGTGTFIRPVKGYAVGDRYGYRINPISGNYSIHYGIDLQASYGTNIFASDGGVVVQSGWNGSYGYSVIIDHGGLYKTLYGHCSQLLVSVGDSIYQEQIIAKVGSTGDSTGPHCHFEIMYDGVAVDPENYLSF